MKKWIKLLAVPLTVALLVACNNDGDGSDDAAEDDNGTDATTAATQVEVTDAESLSSAVSDEGAWIIIFQDDLETDEELTLTGGFEHNDEPARKLALYTQDDDRNILEQFTLTAPSITIQNENARIQGGTFAGDVYVEADGFSIPDGTIDGNLIFASEEYQDSADLTGGEVTGEVSVGE